jgi:hypothetical protein
MDTDAANKIQEYTEQPKHKYDATKQIYNT